PTDDNPFGCCPTADERDFLPLVLPGKGRRADPVERPAADSNEERAAFPSQRRQVPNGWPHVRRESAGRAEIFPTAAGSTVPTVRVLGTVRQKVARESRDLSFSRG